MLRDCAPASSDGWWGAVVLTCWHAVVFAFLQALGMWLIAVTVPVVLRADGKDIPLQTAFIALWILDG